MLAAFLENHDIKWYFQTPKCPWKGGHFERLVGLVKSVLSSSLRRKKLSIEDFTTILAEVQCVINSRPLTHVEDDAGCEALTPNRLLFGRDILLSPILLRPYQEDWNSPSPAALRASYTTTINTIKQAYKAFRLQYLTALKVQCRAIRAGRPYNPSKGDLVLISTERHRHHWPLARVVDIFPTEDGIVRTVKLYDGKQHLLRDPRQLLPLECDDVETALEPTLSDPPASVPVPDEEPAEVSPPTSTSRPMRAAAARQRRMMRDKIDDIKED